MSLFMFQRKTAAAIKRIEIEKDRMKGILVLAIQWNDSPWWGVKYLAAFSRLETRNA